MLQELISLSILDILCDFMIDYEEELNTLNSNNMRGVLSVLQRLLHGNRSSPKAMRSLYTVLQYVFNSFKSALFLHPGNSKFCESLCFEILSQCNSNDDYIRSKASSLFYLLLKVP
jgi:hypothetical protein